MEVNRNGIIALIAGQSDDRTLVRRFMRDLEPVFRLVEDGSFHLADKSMLNHANVGAAIARATREVVSDILPVSAASDMLHPNWRRENDYDAFVASSMMRSRRDSFYATHGREVLDRLVEPLWDMFAHGYIETVRRCYKSFFDDVDWTLAVDVTYGPAIFMAYAAGYAAVGDDKGYADMRGVLRLAPWVLPIGSPSGSDGLWLVLVD